MTDEWSYEDEQALLRIAALRGVVECQTCINDLIRDIREAEHNMDRAIDELVRVYDSQLGVQDD